MGTQVPLPQRVAASPQFSAHVCCGQMAAWIRMPLGMEIGLSPGDFVLDGYPALSPQKGGGALSPSFAPCLLWPNGWMDQGGTRHGGASWSIQPFSHNSDGPKIEWGLCLSFLGELGPHRTKSLGPRPTSVPSGTLVHPAVWPQWTLAKNWGCAPLGEGSWVPS